MFLGVAMNPWYFCDNQSLWLSKIEAVSPWLRPWLRDILYNGYTIIPSSIDIGSMDLIRRDYSIFKARVSKFNPPSDRGAFSRLVNLHCAVPSMFGLFSKNKTALGLLDYLFEIEASLYTTLFFERGSGQSFHRDTPYFWTNPGYRYFGVWVALEDSDTTNGCLRVVPRSNLLPEESRESLAYKFYSDLNEIPAADSRLWDAYQLQANNSAIEMGLQGFDCCVKAGDTIIWHPHTLRGGRAVEDESRTRASLVMHSTPLNQVVYHHNGFFNPDAILEDKSQKSHVLQDGRNFVMYKNISFGHEFELSVDAIS